MLSLHTPKKILRITILDIPVWGKMGRRRLVWSFADKKVTLILHTNSFTILKMGWFIFHYLYTRWVPQWIKDFPKDIVSKIYLISLVGNGGKEFLKGEMIPSPAPLIKGRLPVGNCIWFSRRYDSFWVGDDMFTVSLNRKKGHCKYPPGVI